MREVPRVQSAREKERERERVTLVVLFERDASVPGSEAILETKTCLHDVLARF